MDLEDLAHKPVFDIDTERFLGYVLGTVLDAERTRLLGIVTRTRIARPKMVAPTSLVELLHDDGVMIARAGFRWLPLHRSIWRAARAQRKQGFLRAVCKGDLVGSVVDYTVDDNGSVTHVIVQRGVVGKTTKVRRDKVLEIEDKTMRLADDALDKSKPKPKKMSRAKSEGVVESAAAIFGRTLAKATHRVKTGARSSLVGKPAPWTVKDDEGVVLVREGQPLTAEALAAEASRGKTSELTGAVAGGALGRSLAARRKKK